MALAIITVGTSFQESLCWDFPDVWNGNFEDPLIRPNIFPTDTEVREYKYKMYNAVWQEVTNQANPLERFQNHFRKIITPQQFWRYPAEIDTLLEIQRHDKDFFQSIDEIQLVYSGDANGKLTKDVIKFVISQLWPDTFKITKLKFTPLVRNEQYDYSHLLKNIKNEMKTHDSAFLILTGGYKFLSIVGVLAFQDIVAEGDYRILYKHEDGALIIHKAENETVWVNF